MKIDINKLDEGNKFTTKDKPKVRKMKRERF